MDRVSLIDRGTLRLDALIELSQKPSLFEPGAQPFWDDPHISEQMLAAHLSPDTEAASRKSEAIDRTVSWLVEHLELTPGDTVLDLGCGPGLYSARLSERQLDVTGIDYSRRSIAYAKGRAEEQGLSVKYVYRDFLTLDYDSEFDLALQIYGEVNAFSPDNLDHLLSRIHRALKPAGRFVFDVTTQRHDRDGKSTSSWYAAANGFWRPGHHVVLQHGFSYPEHAVHLDQFIVIEQSGETSVYRNWFVDYSLESIRAVLERNSFRLESTWSDLAGTPHQPDSEWIGVIAQKS
jgi:SAM-dependent methyltransferase